MKTLIPYFSEMNGLTVTMALIDGMAVIAIDGHDYAVIDNVNSLDDIDEMKIVEWVRQTYYEGDYLSSAYIPCRLNAKEFTRRPSNGVTIAFTE